MDEVVKFRKQILSSPLVRDVWSRKYRLWENGVSPEDTVFDTQSRVVNGVYWNDTNHIARADALRLVSAGILVPGGRVNAGAGLDRKVSLLNCFVLPTVPDHMPGIQKVIAQGSLTMQQGGGIGVDFSTIRPAGALVSRTGSIASGVIPFADQQDGMCKSIVSAGTRRGAMMLTLCLHGETKIHTLTGNIEIEKLVGQRPYVFACDPITKGVHVVRADRVVVSGRNRQMVRVKFDNRDELVCTPDHRIMRKNGCYTEACNLKVGDRVTAITHSVSLSKSGRMTEKVGATDGTAASVHHLVAADVHMMKVDSYNIQVHHKDENPMNNHPHNLEMLSASQHARRHDLAGKRVRINRMNKGKTWEEIYGQERADTIRQKHAKKIAAAWADPRGKLRQRKSPNAARIGKTWEQIFGVTKAAELRANHRLRNHRVIAVEDAGIAETVYDIMLPAWHNFAANGVFVHNCDTHPDLYNPYQYETMTDYTGRTVLKHPSFISVKRQSGRLTQFNVSVLVSDAFLEAVETDSQWDLGFHIPLADGQHVAVYKKPFPYDLSEMDNEWQEISGGRTIKKGTLMPWYVYQRVKARKIWEEIMRSTYTYAEPGVIFIDRINERNNLNYCEEIRCVNPCGEQPLPPNGCCCLGSINTAFLVNDPFTDRAEFDFDMFEAAVEVGVRFLDNVLDVSNYPLEAQRLESMNKRRIGLGITGWADALLQLQLTYGSQASVNITREVARTLRDESYRASSELAIERGTFLHYDRHAIQQAWTVKRLPDELRERIHENGLRNGVLNTIAPNGTISLYIGNVSSGHEPVFSFEPTRRLVRQEDGSLREYPSIDYAQALFMHLYPDKERPDYCVGALDLPVEAHLAIHAAWQDYIDASISKTINCAPDMAFGDFERVYWSAYQMGCKGVTTFRDDPASGRGTVLSLAGSAQGVAAAPSNAVVVPPRPTVLAGRTHKLKWPLTDTNWYVTITHDEDHVPRELFITTREVKHQEWVTALGRMVTAVLRRGGDISFLVGELIEVHSAGGGVFLDEKYCPSVVAAIGRILEREFISLGIANETESLYMHAASGEDDGEDGADIMHSRGAKERCPQCNAPAWVNEAGCGRCLSCDYSTCG